MRVRAPGVAVGALDSFGVWYRVNGEGSHWRCTLPGMMVQRSATRAVRLLPWCIQSVSSSAILGRRLRASRFGVLLWLSSVAVLGPALMRGLCCGSSAGRLEGGAVRGRGRVVGGPFARGGADM